MYIAIGIPQKKKLPINGFRPRFNGSDGSRVVEVGGLARYRWLDSGSLMVGVSHAGSDGSRVVGVGGSIQGC